MPVVAVLALWQFVAMWNSYFDAMIYLNSASKQPLQLVLRSILIQSQPESGMIADIQSTAERAKMAEPGSSMQPLSFPACRCWSCIPSSKSILMQALWQAPSRADC